MDDQDFSRKSPPAVETNSLLLGLALILLAFFILLSSTSKLEKSRVEQTLLGIVAQFQGGPRPADQAPISLGTGSKFASRDLQTKVTGLFQTAFALDRIEIQSRGDWFVANVRTEDLFVADDVKLRRSHQEFFKQLATTLTPSGDGLRPTVTILFGVGQLLPNVELTTGDLSIARAGRLARALNQSGAPSQSLAMALVPGNPGRITLEFRMAKTDLVLPLEAIKP